MRVHEVFSNYFDPAVGAHANWKKASYFTIVIPILAGLGWLVSGVCGGFWEGRRVTDITSSSSRVNSVKDKKTSSIDLKIAEESIPGVKEQTLSTDSFDYNDFCDWFKIALQTKGKGIFLKQELLPRLKELEGKPVSVHYERITSRYDCLQQLPVENVDVTCEKQWYDYSNERAVYVDFANGEVVGGGFKERGNVQEEKMFMESTQLALFAYLSERMGLNEAPTLVNGIFVVKDVEFCCRVPDEFYGGAMSQITEKKLTQEKVHYPIGKRVAIAGLAAQWRFGRTYSTEDLNFHFQQIYRACMSAKQRNVAVYSGAWGCGMFNNSEKTMIAVQLMAARAAGVKIVLTGVGNEYNKAFSEENVNAVKAIVDACATPQDLFEKIVELQNTDKTWSPKNGFV